jgi:hypothetical protein
MAGYYGSRDGNIKMHHAKQIALGHRSERRPEKRAKEDDLGEMFTEKICLNCGAAITEGAKYPCEC